MQNQQNSTQRKDNKVGNKTCCKKDDKRKKKECEKRMKTDASPPPQKRQNLSRNARNTKKSCLYIQLAENLLKLSVKNLLFSHSHVNQPKTAPKMRIWSKMLFFCYQNGHIKELKNWY